MVTFKEQIKKIREDAAEWLTPDDRKEFAEKYGVTVQQISNMLKGHSSGSHSLNRIYEMHDRAMKNKKALEDRANMI